MLSIVGVGARECGWYERSCVACLLGSDRDCTTPFSIDFPLIHRRSSGARWRTRRRWPRPSSPPASSSRKSRRTSPRSPAARPAATLAATERAPSGALRAMPSLAPLFALDTFDSFVLSETTNVHLLHSRRQVKVGPRRVQDRRHIRRLWRAVGGSDAGASTQMYKRGDGSGAKQAR